ncbi:MAG: tetratricopeptide repeat protein [Pontiellaceae bacterium]
MKKIFLISILFLGFNIQVLSIPAELVMSGGRTWSVDILKRIKTDQKDTLQLSISGRTAGIPVSSIQKINYSIESDIEQLMSLKEDRQFDILISELDKKLKPYRPYMDIPSNLMRYEILLMELYFLTDDYNKTIELAKKIQTQSVDEIVISASEIFHVRSLIQLGLDKEAEFLLKNNGWFDNINGDSEPEKLFILAELMRLKSNYNRAIELVSYIIAFNSQDPEWTQPAELLCAELYIELEMFDSAEEVITQIMLLYPNTIESEEAGRLSLEILALRAKNEL